MGKESIIKFIQKNSGFSENVAKEIASYFEVKNVKKNDFFLSEGKICAELMFLEEGYMRVFINDLNGCEVTTRFYSQNHTVYDASSFFSRNLSKENIQALTNCKGWSLSFEVMNILFHSFPEFREFGRSILVKELVILQKRMVSALTETAEDRYLSLIKSNPNIFQYSSLKNISSYLGVTDSSLSRIRKIAFKKQG